MPHPTPGKDTMKSSSSDSQGQSKLQSLVDLLYGNNYPPRVALLLTFELLMYSHIAVVMLYAIIFGTHPANAFLSAVFGPLGLAIVAMALRFQLNDAAEKQQLVEGELKRKRIFGDIPEHRAFVEYTLGSVLILLGTFTFLG